jgi:FlaG/FlaF family flagellin (archaellin)
VSRGISPVIGVVLLAGCTILLSVTIGAMAFGYEPTEPVSVVVVSGEADATENEITLTLERGDPLDVQDISLVISVDGKALEKQPTVPTYAQSGFDGFPTGPFNPSSEPTWNQGQSAGVTVASTNDPLPEPGSTVEIRIFENDLPIATVETTAR